MSYRTSSRSNATPVFESGRLERAYSGSNRTASRSGQPSRSGNPSRSGATQSRTELHIVKEETDQRSGNKVQLVRTIPEDEESSDDIVQKLMSQYSYRSGAVRAKK